MVCLATAHPAKFPEAIRQSGQADDPALPHHMADLFDREEQYIVLDNSIATVQSFVKDNISP